MAPTAEPKVLTQEPQEALAFYRGQQATIGEQVKTLTKNATEEWERNPNSPASKGLRDAISALQQQEAGVRKFVSVLENGYAPITLPSAPSHATGNVEDPRLVKISLMPLFAGVALATMVSLLALGLASIIDTTLAGLAMLVSVVVEALPFVILGKRNESRLCAARIPSYGTQRFYKGTVPDHAWASYQTAKASGLFEKIRIWAPREAFHKVTFRDPIIFGEVQGQQFLIAQFNLSLDLQSA